VAGALAALVAVVALSAWFVRRLGARLAVAGATVWGLVWLAQGRLAGDPRSYVVGVAALVAAACVTVLVARGRRVAATP
jgi:hypothetical protein